MAIRLAVLCIALSVSMLACSARRKVESVYTPAVYAAIIDWLFTGSPASERTVVLRDEMQSFLADRVSTSFLADIDTLADGDSAFIRNFWDGAARRLRMACAGCAGRVRGVT